MRNLIQFFFRFHALFLFLFLELLCVVLVIRNHTYQRNATLSASNSITGSIYQASADITGYLDLNRVNDSLRNENAKLLAQLDNAIRDNSYTEEVGCNALYEPAYTFIGAKVISNSTTKANNYLVIDRGSMHGIQPNMGVMLQNGIVGIVKDVSERFSTVISVLHKDTKISSRIKGKQYVGSVQWPGNDPTKAIVKGIPKHVKVQVGDTLLTSGYSSIFPEDVMVATVLEYSLPPGSNFYDINVALSANFETLRYVYVVKYLFKDEQQKLEELSNGN